MKPPTWIFGDDFLIKQWRIETGRWADLSTINTFRVWLDKQLTSKQHQVKKQTINDLSIWIVQKIHEYDRLKTKSS